jgi:two-component system sensor histidine kinase VicK
MLYQDYGNRFVEVWISDTGIGIPKELLKKIFEKFYQIKRNKFEKLKGSGLGLSLTSEIISLYKSTIWAESKVGEGCGISQHNKHLAFKEAVRITKRRFSV